VTDEQTYTDEWGILERLLAHTRFVGECWVWDGAILRNGYGYIGTGSRTNGTKRARLVHRVAYETLVGEIPSGANVLHHCDVRSCWRPDHLHTGSKQANSDEMVERGRSKTGQKHWNARLDPAGVHYIRSLADAGYSGVKIAAAFGVSHQHVSNIVRGLRWRVS
jgi:hypothetical protein